MKKRNTYRINNSNNNLIRTEEFDSNQKLIKDTNFEHGLVVSETAYTYDNSGNMTSETQTNEDGVTASFYEYNNENKIISHKQLFNDELYEEVQYKYDTNSVIMETIQDNEIISKLVRIQNEDKSGTREMFGMDGKLTEKHITRYNAADNSYETEAYNEDDKLMTKIIERGDSEGRPTEVFYLNQEGKLFQHKVYTYSEDKLTEVYTKDFYSDIKETTCINEYNQDGLLSSQKLYNINDEILQNCLTIYNDKGDIIEESSLFSGNYLSVAGILNNGQSFHFLYEIEY